MYKDSVFIVHMQCGLVFILFHIKNVTSVLEKKLTKRVPQVIQIFNSDDKTD